MYRSAASRLPYNIYVLVPGPETEQGGERLREGGGGGAGTLVFIMYRSAASRLPYNIYVLVPGPETEQGGERLREGGGGAGALVFHYVQICS